MLEVGGIQLGDFFLGTLATSIWWIFFIFKIILPKFKALEDRYENEKEEIVGQVKDEMKAGLEEYGPDLEGHIIDRVKAELAPLEDKVIDRVKAELAPLEDKVIERVKAELAPMKEEIGAYAQSLIMVYIKEQVVALQDPNNATAKVIFNNLALQFWRSLKDNPDLEESMDGFINAKIEEFASKFFKHIEKHPEILQNAITDIGTNMAESGEMGGMGGMMNMLKQFANFGKK